MYSTVHIHTVSDLVNTGRLYFIEEMFDLNHMSVQDKPDYLYYVDKVNEG